MIRARFLNGRAALRFFPPAALIFIWILAGAACSKPKLNVSDIHEIALHFEKRIHQDISAQDRLAILNDAARQLPVWYRRIGITPPSVSQSNWLEIVIYDSMSDPEFSELLASAQKITQEKFGRKLDPVGRRDLAVIIADLENEGTPLRK